MRDIIEQLIASLETKDMGTLLALFSDDGELVDPHYPIPVMRGRKQIRHGVTWGFDSLKKFGFTIERYFECDDGRSAVVELATAHVLPNGKPLNFAQVFVVAFDNKHISSLHAYTPYGPCGLTGLKLKLSHQFWKLRRKLR